MLTEHKAIYIPGIKQGQYDVVFDGKRVVTNSYSPFSDTARYLLSQGLKGKLVLYDQRGVPCLLGGIEKAATQIVYESRESSPRFARSSKRYSGKHRQVRDSLKRSE